MARVDPGSFVRGIVGGRTKTYAGKGSNGSRRSSGTASVRAAAALSAGTSPSGRAVRQRSGATGAPGRGDGGGKK